MRLEAIRDDHLVETDQPGTIRSVTSDLSVALDSRKFCAKWRGERTIVDTDAVRIRQTRTLGGIAAKSEQTHGAFASNRIRFVLLGTHSLKNDSIAVATEPAA